MRYTRHQILEAIRFWNRLLEDEKNFLSDNEKIDYVFLYCNSGDAEWQKMYRDYIDRLDLEKPEDFEKRYIDKIDTVKYSLRSIDRYFPWIGNVYIVVCGESQIPDWMNTDALTVVTHNQILPKNMMPCFNSIAIEHYISKIPGLSEKFIYGNDDCIALRPLDKSMFFTNDGKLNISIHGIGNGTLYTKQLLNSWKEVYRLKNIDLPEQFKNATYELTYSHAFKPNIKSVRRKILDTYEEDIKNTFSAFRRDDNLGQIEIPYYYLNNYMADKSDLPDNFHSYMAVTNDNEFENLKNMLFKNESYTIVINDCSDEYAYKVKGILDKRFNFKSRFEK